MSGRKEDYAQAHIARLTARGVVEQADAPTEHCVWRHLVGKSEAWAKVWPVLQHAGVHAHSANTSDKVLARSNIKIGPTVKCLVGRAEIIPAQPIVQGEVFVARQSSAKYMPNSFILIPGN